MAAYPNPVPRDEFSAARAQFDALVVQLQSAEADAMTHAELEELVSRDGRELQRRLVQAHLALRAAREAKLASVKGSDDIDRTHRRQRSRPLTTVFGNVNFLRWTYGARGETSLAPLDGELNVPPELYSHGLRRHAAIEAARGSFDQAVEAVERATGVKLPKRQLEQLVNRAAVDFDAFYARERTAAPTATTNDLLVLTVDNKGVVMRREHLREATRRRADAAEPKLAQRLSKGEKKNRKRMATVAAIYDLVPQARRPADVMADLRPVRDVAVARPRATNKRVWAHVGTSATAVTAELFDEAHRRDPQRRRRWVALVDGDRQQIARVRAQARRVGADVTLIVDFIHVLEYLWGAAWCFFAEGDRAAEAWVTERARRILEGQSSSVAAGLRRSATLRGLTSRKGVDACAGYLLAKRRMLRYDVYLREGYPIATGVIEGACRHLVKDRMDVTGARWSVPGAEAVLRLRSLRASGDFETYWRFHLDAEHRRNHASRVAADGRGIPRDRDRPILRVVEGGASS